MGLCMVDLHVEMTVEERELLRKWKGKKKWKEWLLSIPQLLREAADAREIAELKLEKATREIKELEERCQHLQRELGENERDSTPI
ncbi:hypothetical protein ES707_02794 [subsurface metagenome]